MVSLTVTVFQVFAASAGNHALALSMHGKKLGVEVNVVMPRHAPIMKINRCEELGANIIIDGNDIGASREIALRLAKERGGKYINGYDHIDILAGAGTVGLEIIDQVTNVDAVLVPVGGCGLIAGVAVAVKTLSPKTRVIGVASETCPALIRSLEKGEPVYTPTNPTLADGLAVPAIGVNAFRTLRNRVDEVISVPEHDIAIAILRLLEFEKVVCEGAGAITIGALLSGKLNSLKGKKVVSILSGGNIDTTSLGRCIDRGLAYDNRVIRFTVIIKDTPGDLSELCTLVSNCGASVKDIYLERAYLRNDMSSIRVKMVTETRGLAHVEQIRSALYNRYTQEKCTFRAFRQSSENSF
ncbi:unnamed protein product [Caenorhabditis auriculariae]|uniref:L-serine deaminase n=1 Tax=Caenorhabditis auriculariae TaxID=2777116 RepID=A0A8S1GXZ1_9PELO|nr:unnamed protein product [Caenorhabditis auriculariae]